MIGRFVGTYLKFRIAFALAALLALGGAIVSLRIGGLAGLFGLFALGILLLVGSGVVLITR